MSAPSFIHPFASGVTDPGLLGGKGASLARMAALGAPVPSGFTVSTEAWRAWRDGTADDVLTAELTVAMGELERVSDRRFGDVRRPLLVSVRSGAVVSMPGMMDTVLNVGLTDDIVAELASQTGERFAYAIYARLLESYAEVVRGIEPAALRKLKDAAPARGSALVRAWQELLAAHGDVFPQQPARQLTEAVQAVWRSWDSPRAKRYRRYRGIADDLGTAVTVQRMVFGNLDDRSGTGVAFTRDPASGAPGAYGDFLLRAQGEDVVSGATTPEPLTVVAEKLPEAFAELSRQLTVLERSYRDMCDIEFTIESGKLWILQARVGQRSGAASVRIAADMVAEGLIDVDEALHRVPLAAMQELQAPVRVAVDSLEVLGQALAASPGTAIGELVFDAQRAEARADDGADVILLRPETSPHDVGGMIAARGVVTATGGRTSHAAVVARGLGRPAVCGMDGLAIDPDTALATFPSGRRVPEGATVTVDGSAGLVLLGAAELATPEPTEYLDRLLVWCADRTTVPVLDEVPPGIARVRGPEDVVPGAPAAAVDIDWEGAESAAVLSLVCAELGNGGCPAWLLVVPPALRGADMRPPAGPWEGIVASRTNAWAGTLLAARIESTAGDRVAR